MEVSFNELEKMILEGKALDKIEKVTHKKAELWGTFHTINADVDVLIEKIKSDIQMLKTEYKMPILDIVKYIKNPVDFVNDFYTKMMKRKDEDMQDVDIFMKLYGIEKPNITEYNKSILNYIKIDTLEKDNEKIEKDHTIYYITDDKARIFNIVSFIYDIHATHNIQNARATRKALETQKEKVLSILFNR
jgi:hypothetical protein